MNERDTERERVNESDRERARERERERVNERDKEIDSECPTVRLAQKPTYEKKKNQK